jgi:hypothetical protein
MTKGTCTALIVGSMCVTVIVVWALSFVAGREFGSHVRSDRYQTQLKCEREARSFYNSCIRGGD